MLPSVEEALRQQLHQSKGHGQYVFSNVDGGPLHRDNMRNRVWNEAVKNAGLRYRNPYQTRHSFASLMLEENASPAWVAKRLGYTTMKMLYERCGRFIRNRQWQDWMGYEAVLQEVMGGTKRGNHP
jgi:integrase